MRAMPSNAMKRAASREVLNKMEAKGGEYHEEPIDEFDMDLILAQIQIKATRARRAIKTKKLRDELIDTAVYSILALAKIMDEEAKQTTKKGKPTIDAKMTKDKLAKELFKVAGEGTDGSIS